MHFLIHDFAGHPFQIQLSRELARRGHAVTHAYPVGLQGPKGRLAPDSSDPENLQIRGIQLSATFQKYSAWRRFTAQRQYARDLIALIEEGRFDVVLSGNTPIDVQAQLLWHCRRHNIGFVHWVQDVYSRAIEYFLRKRLGGAGRPISAIFAELERRVTRRSDAVVVIASAFRDLLVKWNVPAERIHLIENWAALDEVKPLPRENAWSTRHGLNGKTVFLYSGTLGLKHRPDLLQRLVESLDDHCKLVVITEGVGRDYLAKLPKTDKLLLLDFQPYGELSEVLASADVLIATLERDAGEFAVPSKILTYLCAGRPILMAAPPSNLSASIVRQSGAGVVIDSDDPLQWTTAAQQLSSQASMRGLLGQRGRQYAETTFDIERIATAFETVLMNASRSKTPQAIPAISVEAAPGARTAKAGSLK